MVVVVLEFSLAANQLMSPQVQFFLIVSPRAVIALFAFLAVATREQDGVFLQRSSAVELIEKKRRVIL